jgi:4-oxalocrotonate tautomerase
MPFARLTITAIPLPKAADDLARELTNLIARDLGKRHELTSVLVEAPSGTHWTIGAELRPVAAHLEVCVTAGTNTEDEKRAFVAHAMAMLHHALPGLDPATYVVVKELSATDWGYDGLTQADRATARS